MKGKVTLCINNPQSSITIAIMILTDYMNIKCVVVNIN